MSNFIHNLRNPQTFINGGIGCLIAGGAMWLVGITTAVPLGIAGAILLVVGFVMKSRG
jgi:hypothetical protein